MHNRLISLPACNYMRGRMNGRIISFIYRYYNDHIMKVCSKKSRPFTMQEIVPQTDTGIRDEYSKVSETSSRNSANWPFFGIRGPSSEGRSD